MSVLIDIPAALVASPRPCAPVAGARLRADDAQPRLLSRPTMAAAPMAWRHLTGSTKRGLAIVAQHKTQDERPVFTGGTYATTNHSTRSGPPTSRPPA